MIWRPGEVDREGENHYPSVQVKQQSHSQAKGSLMITCPCDFQVLWKVMATHSSILAWRIPWTEEPGRLQSMGLQRFRPNWATNTQRHSQFNRLCLPEHSDGKESVCQAGGMGSISRFRKFPWRRAWQHTPVLLPGEFQGQRSLVGYSP